MLVRKLQHPDHPSLSRVGREALSDRSPTLLGSPKVEAQRIMSAHAKAARPGPVEGMKKQQSWKTYKRERNEAREKLEREEAAAAEAAAHQPADSILDVVMLAQSSMVR